MIKDMTGIRKPFTVVELLIVITVLSILAGLLLPALKAAQEQAKAISCMSNLKQIALGTDCYLNDNKLMYPIACEYQNPQRPNTLPLNWQHRIDAYLTKTLLPFNLDWTTGYGESQVIPVWNCQTDCDTYAKEWYESGNISYFANAYLFRGWTTADNNASDTGPAQASGVNGNGMGNTTASQVADPAHTLMVGHWTHSAFLANRALLLASYEWWANSWRWSVNHDYAPENCGNPAQAGWMWNLHGGGANYLAADGHAVWLTSDGIGDCVNPAYGYSTGELFFVPPPATDMNW
jgi:prepilin-type processing-associated H-X9-DG protein